EVQGADLTDPVEVVHHRDRVLALEIEEAGDLTAQALHPLADDLSVVEHALARHPRIPDQTGRPAHQGGGAMAGELEPAHGEHLRQMADVEGRRCRVETAIQADRSVRQSAAERVAPGSLHDESSPGELVQDGMHRSVPLGGDVGCRYMAPAVQYPISRLRGAARSPGPGPGGRRAGPRAPGDARPRLRLAAAVRPAVLS